MARFETGERVRAVTFDVTVNTDEGREVTQAVTLRYRMKPGVGAMPVHSCIPSNCDYCIEKATLQALRRQAGTVASAYATRDRLTTAR